jgi:hypothetical protein
MACQSGRWVKHSKEALSTLHRKIRLNESVLNCTLIKIAILAELPAVLRDLGDGASPPRIHADVVHQHTLGKIIGAIRILREHAADSHIQY